MATNEESLKALSRRLALMDEARSQQRLEAQVAERGPAPVVIEPAPRGTYPVGGRGLPYPRELEHDFPGWPPSATALDRAIRWQPDPPVEAGESVEMWGFPREGHGLSPGERNVVGVPDVVIDRALPRILPAGSQTVGPRIARELRTMYLGGKTPVAAHTMGSGTVYSPETLGIAADRVEQRRLVQRAEEAARINKRQQEAQEYGRWLETIQLNEAAEEQALTGQFGTPRERAEDILALEALMMEE